MFESFIDTPDITGYFSVIALVHCIAVNCLHFYLTKTSRQRNSTFGKRLMIWSHLSMIFMTIAPLLMIFSYFHIETIFTGDNNDNGDGVCLCHIWYSFAVIAFSTGLFLLKINYLVRLNMVIHPWSSNKQSPIVTIYLIFLTCEMIINHIVQYLVIDGDCLENDDGTFKYGCIGSFAYWNGIMATAFLVHDLTVYFVFCRYFFHKMKLGKLQQSETDATTILSDQGAATNKTKGTATGVNTKQKTSLKPRGNHGKSSKQQQESGATESGVEGGSGDGNIDILEENARTVTLNKEQLAAADVDVGTNDKLNGPNTPTSMVKMLANEAKVKLVYQGLLRQFKITLVAIIVCIIDLVLNTIFQNYNLLFLFMIDCMINVTLNFLVFRDSRVFVHSKLSKMLETVKFCGYLCCCPCSMEANDVNGDDDEDSYWDYSDEKDNFSAVGRVIE